MGRQHCPFRRYHHVPRNRRPYAEGDLPARPTNHEDQDHRPTREEILCLDRRIHPGFPVHLPTDVDLQARIRRIWPSHRPPKMLLNASHAHVLQCLAEASTTSFARRRTTSPSELCTFIQGLTLNTGTMIILCFDIEIKNTTFLIPWFLQLHFLKFSVVNTNGARHVVWSQGL